MDTPGSLSPSSGTVHSSICEINKKRTSLFFHPSPPQGRILGFFWNPRRFLPQLFRSMEEQEGIEASEGGALEKMDDSQPARSPSMPSSSAEAEESPVFDHAATPGPAVDLASDVCGIPSIEQSSEGEEASATLWPTDQSIEKPSLPPEDYSRTTGSPLLPPSTTAPEEDEKAPLFGHAATLGPTISSGDRGGDEAPDVHMPQSMAKHEGTDLGAQEMDDSQLLGTSAVRHSASEEEAKEAVVFEPSPVREMDDSQFLDCSAPPHSAFAEEGKKSGAFEAAPEHGMDDSPFLGSSAATQSASVVEDKEAATADEGKGGTVEVEVGAQEMDDSQPLGFHSVPASASSEEDEEAPVLEPSVPGGFTIAAGDDDAGEDEVQMDVESSEPMVDAAPRGRVGRRGGRKRGRPPMVQAARTPAKRRKEKEKEKEKKKGDEEVCFICFDGGDLVVCDRRGCPKVYHPSCVNRDEAFFRAKGRWNCGWHICSSCEKSAQYMCYTCTFSLCKGCISEAGFARVRGNKGFCVTCLSTVMLIESNKDGMKKMDGIDFDDKSSWMSFFKDYWLDLKGKLSLTSEELTRARTPSKEFNEIARNESSDDLYKANDDHEASSDSSSGRLKESISSRKKAKKRSRNIATDEGSTKEAESEGTSTSGDVNWASIELLEFVAHMKDGDKSALSQFDVQALLLDYIKRNNLRDPRKKSYIICDSRLQNLFGKTRVGHFEMLKLLESHFLTKEPSPVVTDDNQEGVVDPDPSQMDTEGNSDASTMMPSDRRRKARKRVHEKEPQTNLDDYAAIDVHNINVMYLRRNLMEDLIDDIDTFGDKVVGSFVRIRISGSGQRQDIYRLVQVIGTGNAAKKYRTGKKTTDYTLEISNLNKTEFITIDIISNQEFTEEECKRLRQSIKCGFISPLTVGEIKEKARVLQALRVNDWLESEKLRLGNLRDRASEKGRRKELRECVEKLQLLSTPEERMRRLNEAPEIHADPKMDPDYESSEDEEEPDDRQQDNSGYPRESSFLRKGSDGISPGKGDYTSSNNWNSPRKSTWETNRSAPTESTWDLGSSTSTGNRTNQSSLNQVVHQTSGLEAPRSQANAIGSEVGPSNNNQAAVKSGQSSAVPSETTSAPLSAGVVAPSSTSETEKMWHYQDPSGKVQGPFSMTQLRKWNKSGYFPTSLSIWRTSERHEDSILLSDALVGKYQKDLPQLEPQYNITAQPVKVTANRNDASSSSTGINESARTGMWASQPSACTAPRSELVNTSEGRPGISSGGWQSSKDFSGQPQGPNSPRPVAPFSGNPYRSPPYQGRGGRGRNAGRWSGVQDYQNNWNSNRPPSGIQPGGQGYEMQRPNWSSSSQQSPGGHWNNQPVNNPSNQWRGNSNNPSTPQPSTVGWPAVQGALNNPSPSTAPIQPMLPGWGPTPMDNGAEQPPTAIVGPNITTLTTNPVGGWGSNSLPFVHLQTLIANAGNSFPTAFASVAKTAETADSVQMPAKMDSSGYTQMPNEQKRPSEPDTPIVSKDLQLPSGEMMTQKNSATVLSASESTGFRAGSDKNQSLESARIGPNPTSQQGAGDIRAPSQLNVRQDLPATSTYRESNPLLDTVPSEVHQPSVQQQQHGVAEIKLVVASGTSELASAQGSEATSDLRLEPDGSNINPACAANVRESTRSPKPSQSLSVPVPVNPSNLEVLPEKKSSERPMHPPVPTTRRSKWDNGADSNAGNSQTSHLVSPNTSQLPPSSQWKTSTTPEAAQPSNGGLGVVPQHPSTGTGQAQGNSNMIWGPETAQPTNSGLGVIPQNPITGAEPAQGNNNMIWRAAVQGAANVGWGVVAQGSTNVVWGIPAQGNPNLNVGWGTAVQANANASTGYGVPAQGDTIVNMAWGTPAQGSPNPNAGWGASTQGNTTPNPGWVAPPAQGYPNPNLGSGAPTPGITNQNVGWAAAPVDGNSAANAGWGAGQGNTNPTWNPSATNPNTPSTQQNQSSAANAGWGAGQGNTNPTWNPSATNPNTPSTQQNQSGDRPPCESGHDGGRQSWNRMQSDGRGGSSRPPPRGVGVCRFHESGHCKKGASCNYVHL